MLPKRPKQKNSCSKMWSIDQLYIELGQKHNKSFLLLFKVTCRQPLSKIRLPISFLIFNELICGRWRDWGIIDCRHGKIYGDAILDFYFLYVNDLVLDSTYLERKKEILHVDTYYSSGFRSYCQVSKSVLYIFCTLIRFIECWGALTGCLSFTSNISWLN